MKSKNNFCRPESTAGLTMPAYTQILHPDDRNNKEEDAMFEYHDDVRQIVRYGCLDDSCNNCTVEHSGDPRGGEHAMSNAVCNNSITCQVLCLLGFAKRIDRIGRV